jgi:ribosome-binding ATPase YchF (GTP1/OBG family)|tara:strand:- start:305 stop:577 length:273 start_codon:yes stop_codon:yes gene_type:complete
MSIVTNKEEKKFLTEEELKTLKEIQTQTQSLVLELGEIEMVKLQTEKKHKIAKDFLEELSNKEQQLTDSIYKKYGKSKVNPETGEITIIS